MRTVEYEVVGAFVAGIHDSGRRDEARQPAKSFMGMLRHRAG